MSQPNQVKVIECSHFNLPYSATWTSSVLPFYQYECHPPRFYRTSFDLPFYQCKFRPRHFYQTTFDLPFSSHLCSTYHNLQGIFHYVTPCPKP